MSSAAAPGTAHTDHTDRWIYWTAIGTIVVLCVVGLIAFSSEKNDAEAQQKALTLQAKFKAAGLPVAATTDMIVRTFGTDGGAVCDNPANALGKALLSQELTNGADFVGRRPIRADHRVVAGELLILQTYCPERVAEFQQAIADWKFDNVIKS